MDVFDSHYGYSANGFSFGACVLPSEGETSEKLLKLAVDNVYKAKEMGRNRVVG